MTASTRLATISISCLLLQGCLATYVPAPNEKLVTVHAVGFGSPQMCKNGTLYSPVVVKEHETLVMRVPAGERLTIGAYLMSDGYQVIHYCKPYLSFVPVEGKTYYMNSAMNSDGRCFIELARADESSLTGILPEWSVGPASCTKP